MNTSPSESIKNLSLLSLFISTHVESAMRAALVTTAADAFFHQHPEKVHERFRMAPANTLPYGALTALEERSIVTVAEVLTDEHGLYPVSTAIRRKEDISLHRNALSHPATVKWRKKMVSFIAAKRDAYDLRPALLWDLNRSINEELRNEGHTPSCETLQVTQDMALMLHTILELSRGPALTLWPVDIYREYLVQQAPRYVEGLEKRPDGKMDEPPLPTFTSLEIATLYGENVCILEPGRSTSRVLRSTGEKRHVVTHFLHPIGKHAATEAEALALLLDPARLAAHGGGM